MAEDAGTVAQVIEDAGIVAQVDHVAIEVADFDAQLAQMTTLLGMTCKRIGRYGGDPNRRIAMVGDANGFKIELIERGADELDGPTFRHVAWRVDDVDTAFAVLVANGCTAEHPPRRIDAARARSALVLDPAGLPVQLIAYDPDSLDL